MVHQIRALVVVHLEVDRRRMNVHLTKEKNVTDFVFLLFWNNFLCSSFAGILQIILIGLIPFRPFS